MIAPLGFESGDSILTAGETARARFVIPRTGPEIGGLPLVASFSGLQTTDGVVLGAAPGPPASVLGQLPAAASLSGMTARLSRAPYVNVGQSLTLDLDIANTGQADVGSCLVRLQAPGCAPDDTSFAVTVAGESSVRLELVLRAAAAGPLSIEAGIESAGDANDAGRNDAWLEPRRARVDLVAETPGELRLAIEPGQDRVSAGQTSPWWIALRIDNAGGEPLRLRAPRATDLQFERGGALQADYVVAPPETLDTGGLEIAGGGHGTLLYTVARTGSGGGAVRVSGRAEGAHVNDPQRGPAVALAESSIVVDAEPGLRILSTESVTYRRLHGHDDFRIGSGQPFILRVVVENTGGTWLDSILVGVDTQRGNSTVQSPTLQAALGPGQRGALELPAVAGSWLSQPGLPETFNAYILTARDRNSGLAVLPAAAVDNTSFAYVESPARLDLALWIDSPEGARDGIVSAGQVLVLAARADNLGTAGVSSSGRLQLDLPSGFALESGDVETFFVPGEVVEWTVRAPSAATAAPGDARCALRIDPARRQRR